MKIKYYYQDERGHQLEIRGLMDGMAIGVTLPNGNDISCILTPDEMHELGERLIKVAALEVECSNS